MPFVFKRTARAGGRRLRLDRHPVPGPGSGAARREDYNVIESAVDERGAGRSGRRRADARSCFPSYDGRLHAYWLDKTEHGSWPYDVPGHGHPLRAASRRWPTSTTTARPR